MQYQELGKPRFWDDYVAGKEKKSNESHKEFKEKINSLLEIHEENQSKSGELAEIRATLLVNFGDTKHNQYGIKIEDKGSTLGLLVEVLEKLTERCGDVS